MNKSNRNNSLLYYWVGALVIFVVLQFFLAPVIKEDQTGKVSYDKFVEMVDKNQVKSVEKQNYKTIFKAEVNGKESVYETGNWDDPDITERLLKSGVEFGKKIEEPLSPFISLLLTAVLPMVLLFVFFYFISRSMTKTMGKGSDFMSFGKSKAKVYVKSKTGKTFDDVAGQEEAKESLTEVVDYLHNSQKYQRIGAKIPRGVLLVGPPGTGKTLLAQAVAGEANVPFFLISGSEFVEMFVGLGASKVRDLFKQAKEKAPCIVFIDEIDAIGKKRDVSGFSGNDEREQTLNQLLNEMDGFDASEGVVLLAATNRPEILDPALTRPGRFDRQIRVELPDKKGRHDILKVHAKDVKMADDIDFDEIATMTAGTSGADLANIINEGALRAVRMGRDKVTQEDLVESIETVIAGQQKKNAVISEDQKKIIAYHEVGHALVTAVQTDKTPVTKITIIPRTSGALGYTMTVDRDEKYIMTKQELFDEIVTLTGGRSAEEIIFNTKTTGASNDIERATKIARAIVTQYGMEDDFDFIQLEQTQGRYLGGQQTFIGSNSTADKVDEKVMEIIKQAHFRAVEILKDNLDKLHEIANYLLKKETITGDEFMEILKRKPLVLEEESKKDLKEDLEEESSDDETSENTDESSSDI
ncbi:MAG: ATP-dependent zinc metalloprotease FtsH [Peptoniphilaceae bacterium]|nr:ATP-dependent zinc metalloprotease FtsH [Peptoniphilaceae bacterium]